MADSIIDDKDFYVVRKNLNILSVLILILAFTNANLKSLSFLGIQMDLDATKLYEALFMGYIYFLWRFATKLEFNAGFWSDFLQYYLMSDKGVKQKHNFDQYRDEFIENSAQLKKAIEENDASLMLIKVDVIRFKDWPLSKLRLSATFQAKRDSKSADLVNFSATHDIKVPQLFKLRKLIVFCLKDDKFGDYLFPLIPVVVVLIFFLFKSEWQGSLSKLF